MAHFAQALRVPVQLVSGKTQRAERTFGHGMRADARDADRETCSHAHAEAAASRAECAERSFRFDWSCAGCGMQGQFCAQMETSPNNSHGTGVNMIPAVTPALPSNKSRLETFMVTPSLMTAETAHLNTVASMAVFAIGHLHAIVRSAAKARDGMSPMSRL